MPTYVALWKYTRDGLIDIKKTHKRFALAKKIVKSAGGKLISVYGLIGEYDVMTVMEMPDEKALASTVLKICSTGRVTSQTMTALAVDDFLRIAKEL